MAIEDQDINDMNDPSDDLPEMPATFNDAIGQFFGTPQEIIERYSHCVLCGAHLHFNHVTDFNLNITRETSRCPECGLKVRQLVHGLQ